MTKICSISLQGRSFSIQISARFLFPSCSYLQVKEVCFILCAANPSSCCSVHPSKSDRGEEEWQTSAGFLFVVNKWLQRLCCAIIFYRQANHNSFIFYFIRGTSICSFWFKLKNMYCIYTKESTSPGCDRNSCGVMNLARAISRIFFFSIHPEIAVLFVYTLCILVFICSGNAALWYLVICSHLSYWW